MREKLSGLAATFQQGDLVRYSGDDLVTRGAQGTVMTVFSERMTVLFGQVHVVFYTPGAESAPPGGRTTQLLRLTLRVKSELKDTDTKART